MNRIDATPLVRERFLKDFAEVEKFISIETPDRLHQGEVAGILYRMLCDRHASAAVMAKRTKTPLIFLMYNWRSRPGLDFETPIPQEVMRWAPPPENGPYDPKTRGLARLSLGQYLNQPVGGGNSVNGVMVTPRILIKLYRDKLSGVHSELEITDGTGKNGVKAASLLAGEMSYSIGGRGPMTIMLNQVCWDTLRACAAIYHRTRQ